MGCNCGKNKQKFKYVYTDHQGKQTSYDSSVQAEAAKIRNGGKGSIRTVPA